MLLFSNGAEFTTTKLRVNYCVCRHQMSASLPSFPCLLPSPPQEGTYSAYYPNQPHFLLRKAMLEVALAVKYAQHLHVLQSLVPMTGKANRLGKHTSLVLVYLQLLGAGDRPCWLAKPFIFNSSVPLSTCTTSQRS